jgi:Kef-type K+ transport system membrane component KefB
MDAINHFYPAAWPPLSLLALFGLVVAFGTLGGLLAKRISWLPTITGFMAVGLLIGPSGLGLLSAGDLERAQPLIDVALGLILFKLGTSLHPRMLWRTPALLLTSLTESLLTFAGVLALLMALGMGAMAAVISASIAVSSSPSVLIHVSHELHAKGPTLETAKALVALNNVFAFVLFTFALPFALHQADVGLRTAVLLPVYQLLGAVLLGLLVAWVATLIGRFTKSDDAHYRFALIVGAVMMAIGLAGMFQVSPLFSTLTLGIACRWLQRRTRLAHVDFGASSDLFFIILFVLAGARLHVAEVIHYAPLALAFVFVRSLAKVASVYGCGRRFGYPPHQAVSAGLLLVPMAGLAIGLVQSTTHLLPEMAGQVGAVVLAAVAVFETLGPPIAAYALRLSGDVPRVRKDAAHRSAPVAAPPAAQAVEPAEAAGVQGPGAVPEASRPVEGG